MKHNDCNVLLDAHRCQRPTLCGLPCPCPCRHRRQRRLRRAGSIDDDDDDKIRAAYTLRGLEPIEWHPSTDFAVTSEGGTVYASDGVDLSEEDWSDYCEKSAAPVSIMEIEHKFEVA